MILIKRGEIVRQDEIPKLIAEMDGLVWEFVAQENEVMSIHSTSETTCVAKITTHSLDSSLTKLRMLIRSFGSRPAVGSSNTKISGLFITACAISRRCFIPPEYPLIFRSATSVKFKKNIW